jgi:hypothetical protein
MPELPNIVHERLKASQAASVHPDADALTAFAERVLPESERAVVIEHLARCHDCRDILALSLPGTAATETVRLPLPVSRGWLRTPTLRWGVIAAGFAVLAVTGILQYQSRHQGSLTVAKQTNVPQALSVPANRVEDSAKPSAGTPKAAPGSGIGYGNGAAASPASGLADASNTVGNADTDFKKEQVAAASQPSGNATGIPAAGNVNVGGPLKQTPQPPTATPSSTTVDATSAESTVATNGLEANNSYQYRANVQSKDLGQASGASQRPIMDAPVDKAKAPAVANANFAAQAPAALALAPRWAISTTGGLLRSLDHGQTWAIVDTTMSQSGGASLMKQVAAQSQKYDQASRETTQLAQSQPVQSQNQTLSRAQAVAVQKDVQRASAPAAPLPVFRALSAAGSEVWAGGTAGMLYHSSDGGQRWTRVFLMTSGVPSTGDIVGIAFPDPQHGQITTSTQERWITLDAGQTWQKR